MVTQIELILIEAWRRFCDYYDTMAPRYRSLCFSEYGTVGNDYWICWNESDLTFHIRRFLYEILNKDEPFSGIEIHSEVPLRSGNFNGFTNLQTCIKQLNNNGEQPNQPEVDMIIARENKDESFLLCAEVKCFHYENHREGPIDNINDAINRLRRIQKCRIAKSFVFILFDDYYWRNNPNTANEIHQRLEEIRRDGILVLFHTSEAKLREI